MTAGTARAVVQLPPRTAEVSAFAAGFCRVASNIMVCDDFATASRRQGNGKSGCTVGKACQNYQGLIIAVRRSPAGLPSNERGELSCRVKPR